MNDMHYALMLANELYGVEMSEDRFEEIALLAFGKIGNKRVRTYRHIALVDPVTLSVDLPCNFEVLESVTGFTEDWEHATNTKDWSGNIDSLWIEEYIEHRKILTDPLYTPGKYIPYEKVGNKLYFKFPYGPVCITYRGKVLDENGLPEITDKEADAIATYIAYYLKYKDGIATMNKNIIEVAQLLKQDWNIKCDLARVPDHLSQNDMDEILDSKSSWDRKRYNKSFKPHR